MKVARHVHIIGTTGKLRTAEFEQREHLVVPVVAMVEGVVFAGNADRPEMVLASELAKAPKGWNGRPVVGGHPSISGVNVSANDPSILEREQIGLIFNSAVEDDKLVVEAWIDPAKANKPGTVGERVLARLRANEMIEVSVGAFIVSEDAKGEHKGLKYAGIWREIVPDHLAFLSEGEIGACSNEVGCGAPRTATVHIMTNSGLQVFKESHLVDEPQGLKERFLNFLKTNKGIQPGMSDRDLRRALDRALFKSVPAFAGVDSVLVGDSFVIYAAMPDNEFLLFQRGYSVNAKGEVTLKDDVERVDLIQKFEPVAAAALTGACGCGGKKAAATQGATIMNKEARIKALIENKQTPFTAAHQSLLESATEEQLKAFEDAIPVEQTPEQLAAAAAAKKKADDDAAALAAAAAGSNVNQVTAEQYIAQAPPEIQESLREGLRTNQAHRAGVITALKATGRCEYTDAELALMSTQGLERMLKLADVPAPVVEFVGRAPMVPRAAASKKEDVPAPASIVAAFAKPVAKQA